MGSVFSGKPSKEQRMEAQGGASKQGEDGQKVKITGGNTGSGRYDVAIGSDPLLGKEYVVNNDVISMNNGNERYRWNEHSQRYNAIPGFGSGYLLVDNVAAPTPEPSSGGGGGSEQQSQGQGLLADYNPDNVVYNQGQQQGGLLGQGLTTDQIVGGLLPGQEEWIYQVDPNNQVAQDLGTYVNQQWRPLV
jgi:hypothetical protein